MIINKIILKKLCKDADNHKPVDQKYVNRMESMYTKNTRRTARIARDR